MDNPNGPAGVVDITLGEIPLQASDGFPELRPEPISRIVIRRAPAVSCGAADSVRAWR
ncbi:hypothetical protein [Streptomyces sp. NPDC058572]|uniref:hypothetical protein n=1 Tax=Streptomyces sp. NPDC058572 TaxID=3346546 RepID=UPI00364C5709